MTMKEIRMLIICDRIRAAAAEELGDLAGNWSASYLVAIMELRDQLQSALGNTYNLDRELGGGGMSRVFAATETALGRKVVIKVLPAELGAGVNVDRFKREILLAANLQHPHIVPVLAAGEIDGVPYYTMPLIDGESLRERLARGPMPISDAVGILRDVAKALAYAHERGVVHRDIKPDNVLMSGGSATVTDFGIAKALAAATRGGRPESDSSTDGSESSLTVLGTSIGTPTYMAPEQAAADPSTDHRADIYSFGCLAYELLAGRPPFAAMSPRKLLAAHMGERPQPIAELRPDTPPMLADLVTQCLEKDPDARPQSAADIARLLDVVTTGTSHSALAATALSRPGAAKRALLVYALAFIAVVIVAKAAVVGIGLPDWVMPASIVLMILGLPIIAMTAYTQKVARRALLATPRTNATGNGTGAQHSTMATLALKASPHLSWGRTAAIGLYGLAGFVAAIGLFMALRASGIGPFGSLLGAGKLADKDKIIVADFTSTGSDTTLGSVVSEAVRADLGQSPIVSVVTPQTVAAALERMQRPSNTRVDTAVARQVALREGVKAVVSGDILSLTGGGFVVTMRLVSADSGQELASLTASANGAKDLIPTIGGLTHRLRGKMGESLKHLQASPQLAQVTTSSLAALEKFSQGQRAMIVQRDVDKAIPLFKEAVAIDTSFASAYRALATALRNRGQDREGQIRALEKAYAHSDRLPEAERWLTVASYWYSGPHPDQAKAAQAYESLLVIRPADYAALNNLALIYSARRDFAGAEQLVRRSIASNPASLTAYDNLIVYLAEQGKVASMDSVFAAELKVSDNNPRVAITRASILFSRQKHDSAWLVANSISKANPHDEFLATQAIGIKSYADMVHGKIKESLRLVNQVTAYNASHGNAAAPLTAATLDSAIVEALFRDSKDKALALIEAGLRRIPLSSLPPLERPYAALAQAYALAGRADLARAMLTEFERTASSMPQSVAEQGRHAINSAIALAEKRYLDAAHESEATYVGVCGTCSSAVTGMAFDLAQQPDSAIAAFTKFVGSTSLNGRFNTDAFFLAGSYKRLGELWDAKGDRAKAASYYAKFIDLWKDADPELQPKVAEARKRLARLSETEPRS
jgi:eukaryotic-like serine/threonine-protein kinase